MVDMPTMHAEVIKIRRGKRTDLHSLTQLLNPLAFTHTAKAQVRHWRRLASDPSLDFYIAEQDGAVLGALLVCYIRALREQGWQAVLDVALASTSSCELGQALVSFAKTRARKRGCRQLIVWRAEVTTQDYLTILRQGGFRPTGDVLSCDLS
jgi:N-acetylglutamate synthase-like GNAT family acetyltransferase